MALFLDSFDIGAVRITPGKTTFKYLHKGVWGVSTDFHWQEKKNTGYFSRGVLSVRHRGSYPWGVCAVEEGRHANTDVLKACAEAVGRVWEPVRGGLWS